MSTEYEQLREVDKYDAQCPSCAAPIQFNPATGNLSCAYCGYEEHIPEPEKDEDRIAQEISLESATNRKNFDWGTEKKVVICDACAAESVYDALELANVCPYCGSNHVMESSAENSLAPNGICPFEVTSTQADDYFKRWIKGRWFMPNNAKKTAKADAFKGVYLPFWTFDSKTASRYQAQYGINYTTTDKDGKTEVHTRYYPTSGFYQEFIDDELVCATNRHNTSMLQAVAPFDTNNSRAYSKEYLSGYIAERYSIGLEEGWKEAQASMHNHLSSQIEWQIRTQHNADSVRGLHFSTVHSDVTFKYVMLPVWLSSFRYNDKVFQFMVNGQTGKVAGQTPISIIKVTLAIIATILIVAILYFFFGEQ